MDAGVVELDALADADGAGAQYQHRGLVPVLADELQGLVLAAGGLGVVGGVEVGGVGGELAGAGVHHLIGGLAGEGNLAAGEPGDGGVRVAQALALDIQLLGELALLELPLVGQQVQEFIEEPAVDHGLLMELLHGDAPLEQLVHGEQPLVGGVHGDVPQVLVALRGELGQVQGVQGDLRPPDGLHQGHLKGVADGHDLAGGLHLGAQLPLGVDELVEGPLGELNRHVVQGGLEGGVGDARHRVLDLV